MKCQHPSQCDAPATGMAKVVGESSGYGIAHKARVELVTGIVTCDSHFPRLSEIGTRMRAMLSDQLRHQGKRPPFNYSVEKLALDSDQVRLYLTGGKPPQ